MFYIWVGNERKRPNHLINSWREKHPDWEHVVLGNAEVFNRTWINQSLLDAYASKRQWPGVADIVRYETLYEHGGFMPATDSLCLHNIEELLIDPYDSFAVYENEIAAPGLISPLYGCIPGAAFAKCLIDNLPDQIPSPEWLPWQVTGNRYMQKMVKSCDVSRLKIFPSHVFTPIHWTGLRYNGSGKVYSVQQWGSTNSSIYKWTDEI